MADRDPRYDIELKVGQPLIFGGLEQAAKAPPQPEGRVVARTVQIDVREALDLHTGFARDGWHEFLWLSGWRARLAVLVLKFLA